MWLQISKTQPRRSLKAKPVGKKDSQKNLQQYFELKLKASEIPTFYNEEAPSRNKTQISRSEFSPASLTSPQGNNNQIDMRATFNKTTLNKTFRKPVAPPCYSPKHLISDLYTINERTAAAAALG